MADDRAGSAAMRDARTASVEASLQGLIDLAADLLEAPIAAILGAGAPIGPRAEEANALAPFRDRAIARGDVLVVPDAAIDPQFHAGSAGRGAIRFFAGAPLIDRDGTCLGVLCVADPAPRPPLADRTRRRLARLSDLAVAVLAQGRRTMAQRDAEGFVAATSSALITTDATGRITFANPACETLLGYPAGALAGRDVASIVPLRLRGHHVAGMGALTAGGPPKLAGRSVEVTALRADGSEVPIELSLCAWGEGAAMGVGAVMRDISERRRRNARLLRLAHEDPGTGLPNRVRLSGEIDARLAARRPVGLLTLGVDGLRAVTDGFGSGIGAALLEALVVRLAGRLPPGALLARLGEDELAVLLAATEAPGEADLEAGTEACAEALFAALAEPVTVGHHVLHVGARIGAAQAPRDGADAAELMAAADLALERARHMGPRGYRAFTPAMRDAAKARRDLQDALLDGLAAGEVALHYQPQIELATGRLRGVEALIRWNHPTRGLLAPAEFLPAIEASTLATRFGQWCLDEACRQAAAWRKAGLPRIGVAVNLFDAQIRAGTLAEVVIQALARHRLPPEILELEVTEMIALADAPATLEPLRRLRALGVGIALDDFGTGYASLSTLKSFPLTKLKIDRGFVRDVLHDAHDATIVKAVLDIGRSLDLIVIAEGIETPEQEAALMGMGCRYAQGYRYGRPVPGDLLGRRLAEPVPAKAFSRSA
ncbi:putative bifunctional diguanylate cyclase/phosphodiesterase [Methylobacterium sp. HMF5984]|uniref:putative bifunctional diguanylate cyclase/phosphodiesterase n=1 Tax=Methylobacterium sp. HMF5984 TaxID=3367370 RepID=UPI0038546EAA